MASPSGCHSSGVVIIRPARKAGTIWKYNVQLKVKMTETPVHRPLHVFALATFSIALFAVMNVCVKLSAATHSVVEIMFFRNLMAAVPVMILIRNHPQGWALLKTSRPLGHFTRGAVGICGMAFFFMSFSRLPLADATALSFATPLVLTALSVPFLGEKVGIFRWAAVIAGFIGVLIIAKPSGNADLTGIAIALSGAVMSAFAMMMVRKLGSSEHALTIVLYFSLFGTMCSAVALPWFWSTPTAESLLWLCLTGLAGGGAQVLLTQAYALAPAAYVSPFSYLAIIFAAVFGWGIWGEVPSMNVAVGSAIVVGSGLFILYRETVKKVAIVNTDMEALQPAGPTEADKADEDADGDAAPVAAQEESGQDRVVVPYRSPRNTKTGT